MSQNKLTLKRKRFCEEYIIDGNATRAATVAGYKPDNASVQGYNMLQDPRVQEEISNLLKKQQKRTQTDADKIVEEYAKIAFANLKDYYHADGTAKEMKDIPRYMAAAIKRVKETEYKQGDTIKVIRDYELHDKLRALQDLGTHFQLFEKEKDLLPPEKINISVNIKQNKK